MIIFYEKLLDRYVKLFADNEKSKRMHVFKY